MARVTPTYDGGSSTFIPVTSDSYGMLSKIAKQAIYNVKSTNRLAVFDKGFVTNGLAIEEAIIKSVESNATESSIQTNHYPDIVAYYYGAETVISPSTKNVPTWCKRHYETTVNDFDMRAVLLGDRNVADLGAMLVGNLTTSEGKEAYLNYKGLIAAGITNETAIDSPTTATALLKDLRNVVDAFTFDNDDYSAVQISTETAREDIIILMPYQVLNTLDVEALASLYHLDTAKGNVFDNIIPIDTTDGQVIVCDRRKYGRYLRAYQLGDTYVATGIPPRTQYALYVEDLFYHSPLFKQAVIDASDLD